jgi:hypothetical protein
MEHWKAILTAALKCNNCIVYVVQTLRYVLPSISIGSALLKIYFLENNCTVLCVCVFIVLILCLVRPILPLSMDCQFLIAPSVYLLVSQWRPPNPFKHLQEPTVSSAQVPG